MYRITFFADSLCRLLLALLADVARILWSLVRTRSSLIAENLFLRKQLAFYQEHQARPRKHSFPNRKPGSDLKQIPQKLVVYIVVILDLGSLHKSS